MITVNSIALNAIGGWSATTGLAEAARRSVLSAQRCGVEISLENIDYAPTDPNRFPPALEILPRGRTHAIEICYLNVNEIHILPDGYLREDEHQRYLIGSWFWELGSLPQRLIHEVQRVDEVWVPSTFVRDTFRHYSANVVVMPCVVEPTCDESLRRSDFGLPLQGCTFLFHFDANSTFARKNPLGVIDAYRRAFEGGRRGRDVHLVMKVINLDKLPEAGRLLRDEIRTVGGILIEAEMSATEVASLIALSDVYVSLHRAEGFGLGIAEAMYFEKAVIATAFSGPEDFLTPTNSCMVGYHPRTIMPGDLYLNPGMETIYEDGKTWAEPDIQQAARWMQLLADQPCERRRMGAQAGRTIRDSFSALTVGTAICSRLRQVQASRADWNCRRPPSSYPSLQSLTLQDSERGRLAGAVLQASSVAR